MSTQPLLIAQARASDIAPPSRLLARLTIRELVSELARLEDQGRTLTGADAVRGLAREEARVVRELRRRRSRLVHPSRGVPAAPPG